MSVEQRYMEKSQAASHAYSNWRQSLPDLECKNCGAVGHQSEHCRYCGSFLQDQAIVAAYHALLYTLPAHKELACSEVAQLVNLLRFYPSPETAPETDA